VRVELLDGGHGRDQEEIRFSVDQLDDAEAYERAVSYDDDPPRVSIDTPRVSAHLEPSVAGMAGAMRRIPSRRSVRPA
jgi:hypothetical protein